MVIPCYNEAKNIPLLLERCSLLVQEADIEIVIVDNGSSDNSASLLEELLPNYERCRSVRVPVNKGYGYGILEGLRSANGQIIGWTHADLQTDPCDVLNAIEIFENSASPLFVKGKRYGRPAADVIFTIGMSAFETILLQRPFWDINAQPTLFPKSFFLNWDEAPHDFSLDLYAYYKSKDCGLETRRFDVRFGERAHGVSHWNVNWQAKLKFIRRTVGFSLQLRKGLNKWK
nr:glycosyltransferase family 2 protein [Pseudomonas quercus]